MCRWFIFAARSPVLLQDVVLKPENGLVKQSFHAGHHPGFSDRNNATLNADGSGFVWYVDGQAVMYKTVLPAWSDLNLRELATVVRSHTIFGHVRAASPGSVVSRENCHPFRFGRLTFQHNGHVEEFPKLKRAMQAMMTDEAFLSIDGVTDSENMFGLFLSQLKDPKRESPFDPEELKTALVVTIAKLKDLAIDFGVKKGFTSLNFALTDGESVIATRYCDHEDIPPPSLYFCYTRRERLDAFLASGGHVDSGPGDGSELPDAVAAAATAKIPEDGHGVGSDRWREDEEALRQRCADHPEHRALLIASEPANFGPTVQWYAMPRNSMLSYTRAAVAWADHPHLHCVDSKLLATSVAAAQPETKRPRL